MDLDQFYTALLKLVPYKEECDKPFGMRLGHCLAEYEKLVEQLEFDGNTVNANVKKDISAICCNIRQIVTNSMAGIPSEAFDKIDEMLRGKAGALPEIDLSRLVASIKAGKSFYRVRGMDLVYGVKRRDLFHIPISNRGIVKTHRYSSPGYPCLYLGESIYGCWEEMRRPPVHQCAVARFRNEEEIYFINMTIPAKEKMTDGFYQKLMPLVIACMIKVSDDLAIYKPEYIVPQLLIEWLLKYRLYKDDAHEEHLIYGVAYHSTQLNEEFEFPTDKLINYAIPALEVKPSYRYCPALCKTFSLTRPTTNEIEKLKGGYPLDFGAYDNEPDAQLEENYECSDFGNLEKRLENETNFPMYKINYKTGNDLV